MKDNILIVSLLVLILIATFAEIGVKSSKDRYEVVTAPNMLTILVDKNTGETWRNCICSDKSNVPGCWEKMRSQERKYRNISFRKNMWNVCFP